VSSQHEDELLLLKSIVTNDIFSDDGLLRLGLDETDKLVANFKLKDDMLVQELKDIMGDDVVIGPYVENFTDTLKSGVNQYIGKAIAYNLSDLIFAEHLFDLEADGAYNSLREKVGERIVKALPEYLKAFVQEEFQKKIQQIRMKN
jgi:hypothetical protein